MLAWIAILPTTNLRILLTLIMAAATAGRVVWTGETPTWEWLAFLCVWAGLDITQFTAKRVTTFQPGPTT
jgi:hypothetical protein